MAVNLQHDRWSVSDTDFAVRIMVPDLKGFFEKLPIIGGAPKGRSLVIEPGTRALVIDEGMLVGEIPAGSYTLESFTDRLQFWRNKQTTIFLTRCDEVAIESYSAAVPCMDNVCFDISYRWTIQISDILQFMENLMGPRDVLKLPELEELLTPMMSQALYSVVGHNSYDQVRSPDFVGRLTEQLHEASGVRLQRYGLTFIDLQTAQFASDDGDLPEKKGDMWLQTRETQLQRAATQVESDAIKSKIEDAQQKIPLRRQLRESVFSDKLNTIESAEQFESALLEIDKGKLLRREEIEALKTAYQDRREDRGQLREHLLATIDIQREQDLAELRVELDYAVEAKSLQKELDLSQISQRKDSEQWQHELRREQEQAAHRRQQKMEGVEASLARAREVRRQNRDDSWETVLHARKVDDVRGDLEISRAERKKRIVIMQAELNSRLQTEKLEIQKRQSEWHLEFRDKKSASQLDRLQRVQEMNAQFAERQHRMQAEMENLKADSASKRELERIQTMGGLSTEALIATAGTANAALLADLKKHEATQEAAKVASTSAPSEQLNEERLQLYQKMNDAERAKADAISEAYKMAMQAQHISVNQMIGGLAQAATPIAQPPTPGAFPPPISHAAPATSPPPPFSETWYVSLNGQQSPPLPLSHVLQYIQSRQVHSETMVWKNGMSSWMAAGQVPELAHLFAGPAIPPPMPDGGTSGPPPM
ncbi:MAG: GYF domain-containing protein [Fuerstiella sp.]|mgnify:CR=1 FL=1